MIVGGLLGGLGHRLTGRGTSSNRCCSEGEAVVGCLCIGWHVDASIPVTNPITSFLISIHQFQFTNAFFAESRRYSIFLDFRAFLQFSSFNPYFFSSTSVFCHPTDFHFSTVLGFSRVQVLLNTNDFFSWRHTRSFSTQLQFLFCSYD
jgi:hypothetical protein